MIGNDFRRSIVYLVVQLSQPSQLKNNNNNMFS